MKLALTLIVVLSNFVLLTQKADMITVTMSLHYVQKAALLRHSISWKHVRYLILYFKLKYICNLIDN